MPTYLAAYCWKRSPMTQMKPPSMSQKMTPRAEESCAKRACAPSVPKDRAYIMPSSPMVKNVTKLSGFIPER